ncbi:interferon-induced, double-stranded RNA-activated protein kinase [Rhinatrema bivittatum]|uniref:interferon-induced, double-stranded RNA-activated protein kinase n=1 Tax=Rhinatrema bivittatum TaxID=194408 RepID=UPI00112C3E6E|nr:interferon-induced, double-stranded RNA-activated protein kinase [Rhinatrema bivittatum]
MNEYASTAAGTVSPLQGALHPSSLLNPSRYITLLNEYAQKHNKKIEPVYTDPVGPAHLKKFTCRYKIDGREFREGTGNSKVEAKREAARLTFEELQQEENDQMVKEESQDPEINFKGKLNEYCQQRKYNLKFEELERRGPSHDRQFVYRAIVDGKEFMEAEGKTKREAEHKAARSALIELESASTYVNPEMEKDESKDPASFFNPTINYIGKLHEYCQKNKLLLKFEECERHGPPHNQQFVMKAVVGNRKFKEAEGKTKKMAEQKAAYSALFELEHPPVVESSEIPAVALPVRERSDSEICKDAQNDISQTSWRNPDSALEDGIKNMKSDLTSEESSPDTNHKNVKVKSKTRKEKGLAPNFLGKLDESSRNDSFKDFEDVSQLGKGGFGHVYKAKHRLDGKFYAVKKVKLCDEKAFREILALADLDHGNIVRYYHSWKGKDYYIDTDTSTSSIDSRKNADQMTECLFIQMELCEKGTLKDWIKDRDKIDEKQSSTVFKQILQGVEYIHSKNLIHRDLKPSNIFLSEESKIKIGDFGLVTSMIDPDNKLLERTKGTGTAGYMAPEQEASNQYGSEVDIFALGLILYELFWIYKTEFEKCRNWPDIKNGKFLDDFEEKYPLQAFWITKMLSRDTKMRPTASSILKELDRSSPIMFSKTV